MKTLKGIFLTATILCLAGAGWAQDKTMPVSSSFAKWPESWLITTRDLRQPYYKDGDAPEKWVYPYVETYAALLDMTPTQKEEFKKLLWEDYSADGKRNHEEAKTYLTKRMQEILGAAKYDQFLFLTDTGNVSVSEAGADAAQSNTKPNPTRKDFDDYFAKKISKENFSENQKSKLRDLLWKDRLGTIRFKNEIEKTCDEIKAFKFEHTTPNGVKDSVYDERLTEALRRLGDEIKKMKESRRTNKDAIKSFLNQKQIKAFESRSGWKIND